MTLRQAENDTAEAAVQVDQPVVAEAGAAETGAEAEAAVPPPGRPPPIPLPVPPSRTEKYRYIERRLWILTLCSVVSFGCLALSQVRLANANPLLWVYMPFLVFTIAYFLISLWINAFSRDFSLAKHLRLVSEWKPETYPSVDVFLPVCGEPVEVLENTWRNVAKLIEEYPGPATAYVLDDAAAPGLPGLAGDLGLEYLTREERGWFKKAGNLQFGFQNSSGDFILILDADFAPRADLLGELLPYFDQDPRLGIVQSPQHFQVLEEQNWIERGAGEVQELFYRAVQTSRQQREGAICVGSCGVYRRTALEENGGTTLIEHSEDVHTGFDLRRLGWSLTYVPVALATGLCPDTLGAFYNQQYRWCMGSMSLLASEKFRRAKLGLSARLCYISGFFYYLHTALFTFAAPIVPILVLAVIPGQIKVANLVWVLPSVVYSSVIFPMWHHCPYRLEAWACRMIYGWAHLFAIWDILRGKPMGWQATGSQAAARDRTRRLRWGLYLWGGGSAAAWVGLAFWRLATMHPANFALLFGSGLFYAAVVARCLIQPRTTRKAL